ncbi:MAG: RDD family protein [Halococcoides sp.]
MSILVGEVGRALATDLPGVVDGAVILLVLVSSPICWIAALVVFLGYKVMFEAYYGVTPAKHLLGLVVVEDDGSDLSIQSAIVRNICILGIDFVPFGPLFLFVHAVVAADHRHFGDQIADTRVLERA